MKWTQFLPSSDGKQPVSSTGGGSGGEEMSGVRLWAVKRTTAAKGVEWLKHADNEYREFYWGREPESSLAISDGKEEMERAAGERGGVTCEFVPRSELDEVIRVNGILEEQVDDARSREYAAHEENDRLRNELDEARGEVESC